VRLVKWPSNGIGHSYCTIGWKGDAIKAGHHGVGIRYPLVHSRWPRTAKQHLPLGKPAPCFKKNTPYIERIRRNKGPWLCLKRHDHDQHQGMGRMAAENIQRIGLAQDSAVVKTDDDMG
jgi:hypothetical protein